MEHFNTFFKASESIKNSENLWFFSTYELIALSPVKGHLLYIGNADKQIIKKAKKAPSANRRRFFINETCLTKPIVKY
ncbi:hypothetical protein DSM107003_49460 [Trichormus variabilis SAG 1403-4b]|uniref:Uncharacterized protein n=1 Tax=Trichormus variabilis SAG 1403-4b TaxID=447716 RepID=A0A433UFA3_ANAVA|nr:hypothetical protein DSM107003_49460 [Trichormus variabilis SAG 1403-4b]